MDLQNIGSLLLFCPTIIDEDKCKSRLGTGLVGDRGQKVFQFFYQSWIYRFDLCTRYPTYILKLWYMAGYMIIIIIIIIVIIMNVVNVEPEARVYGQTQERKASATHLPAPG